VNHAHVRCCWNQCSAMVARERATTSVPRLGRKIGLVHVCDAQFDEEGVPGQYIAPGKGSVEVARQIELLKGVGYDGYLVFEWPALWVDSLAGPDAVLPEVAKFLRACLDAKQQPLTAYKGDKHAPKFTRVPPAVSGSAKPV